MRKVRVKKLRELFKSWYQPEEGISEKNAWRWFKRDWVSRNK